MRRKVGAAPVPHRLLGYEKSRSYLCRIHFAAVHAAAEFEGKMVHLEKYTGA